MKSTKSEPVGEVGCTRAGCTERVAIYRYVERSARPSMFKGKFYGKCPTHGRVIDAGDQQSQDHVLNTKGAIWGATDIPKPTPAPTPQPAPAAVQSTPKPAWKPEEPAPRPTPKPTTSPAVVPDPPPALERRGWNLWDWWTDLIG